MERLRVRITNNSSNGDYKVDDIGYVDGYIWGADERPYVVVVLNKKIVMVSFYAIEVINTSVR